MKLNWESHNGAVKIRVESSQVSRLWVYTNLIIDHEYVYESGHTTPHTNTDRNSRLFFLSFFLWWFTPNLILNPIPKKGVFSRDPEGIAQNIIIYLSIYLLTYIYRTILAVIICIIKGYLPKIHYIHTYIIFIIIIES